MALTVFQARPSSLWAFYLADTYGDLTATDLPPGASAYVIATGKHYRAISATQWSPTALPVAYSDLTGLPSIPDTTSDLSNDSGFITSAGAPVQTVAGRSGSVVLVKGDVGLGSVDNTADSAKPVSTATQTALDLKVASTRTVAGHALSADVTVSKSDVGLGSVDNTSDTGKPVSTAQQTALDGKQPIDADLTAIAGLTSAADKLPYFTGAGSASVTAFTAAGRALVDDADASAQRTTLSLGNVDNTSDANKPVSTATQTALNAKEATANKGVASGYAGLDVSAKVPLAQLPVGVGLGDLVGPTGATDDVLAVFDGVTGKLLKSSTIDKDNVVLTTRSLTINGTALDLSADRSWTVTASTSEIVSLNTAPTISQTLAAGYCAILLRRLSVAAATKLTLGAGSIFRIDI